MKELVWTKKGFDYVLRVKDGYLFVRGWKKRLVLIPKEPAK